MISVQMQAVIFFIASLNLPNINIPVLQFSQSPPHPLVSILPLIPGLYANTSVRTIAACTPDVPHIVEEGINSVTEKTFVDCVQEAEGAKNKTHPEIGLTTSEILKSHGYPVAEYNVTTKDGYILTVHRIPKPGRTPVYLQHGLGGSSDAWVYMYTNQSLAYLISDAGYDVWLGNFRGSTYSLGHVSLQWDNPTNYSYWDFSWHENGRYDVPAMINLILEVTGKPKLFYYGYSMGAQSYFIALDLLPEFNDKIEAAFLLAPGGFVGRTTNPLRLVAPSVPVKEDNYLEPILQGRVDELSKLHTFIGMSQGAFCTFTAVRCVVCDYAVFALFGFDAPLMNYTNLPNIVSRYPNIMSLKTLYHYAQGANNCDFRQYDYGPEKNMRVYNNATPPAYTLQNVKVKTYAFHGLSDNVFRPRDVERTLSLLPKGTLQENFQVNSTYFNHGDFMIATKAPELIYHKAIKIMKGILGP